MYEWDLPEYRRNYGEPLHEEWWQYQEIRLSPMTSKLLELTSFVGALTKHLTVQNIATPGRRCTQHSLVVSYSSISSISSLTGTTGYLGNNLVALSWSL